MGDKRHSYGATIGSDVSGGSSYTDLAGVIDIEGPSLEATITDVSDLASANAAKEKLAGMIDGGEVTLTLHADDTEYNTVRGWLAGRTQRAFQIEWSQLATEATSAPNIQFEAIIQSLGNSIPEDDKITFSVTLAVTGLPTFNVGA